MTRSLKNTALYPAAPIILVDDEIHALDGLEILLRNEGMNNAVKISDPRRVIPTLKSGPASAVLLDLIMPHLSGEIILPQIVMDFPEVPVIIVTGNHNLETAVGCMKRGAFDFLVKPVDAERVITCLRHAIGLAELRVENRQLRERIFAPGTLDHPECFKYFATGSPAMLAIFQYIEAITGSSYPVLVVGETGVGKELIARAIHTVTGRPGAFVPVNVAGLDDQMFTDTLFGHVRGAFTGADGSRSGLISKAADGTLFLDEIGDLSQNSQLKLLRLLQECEYRSMGSDEIKRTNARVIVATNKSLETLRQSGTFRNDLYYRLATHEIDVPPLRRRREDIPLLINSFIVEYARETGQAIEDLPENVINLLMQYDFPGNVRELKSVVFDIMHQRHAGGRVSIENLRRKLRLGDGPVMQITDNFQMQLTGGQAHFSGRLPHIKSIDNYLIEEAMRRANGRQATAAALLGISQQALSKRLMRRKK